MAGHEGAQGGKRGGAGGRDQVGEGANGRGRGRTGGGCEWAQREMNGLGWTGGCERMECKPAQWGGTNWLSVVVDTAND